MRRLVAVLVVVGCGAPARLQPAGSKRDDGHGLLARASVQFLTGEDDAVAARADAGVPYGGSAYGGSAYGGYVVPAWTVTQPNRTPRYRQVEHLAGAIEGTVTWHGPAPAKLATACGVIEPRPAVADVLVYVERVQVGRILPFDGRPIAVGGTIVKRGCTLAPAVQIVTPLPAALAIHGDATPARVRIDGAAHELQAGGRIALQLREGVTRVDSPAGALAAAWAIAIDTPYYALTDDQGRYRIDQLAGGTYELTIWQAPQPRLVAGSLAYGDPVVVKRRVTVRDRQPARLDVALSPSR